MKFNPYIALYAILVILTLINQSCADPVEISERDLPDFVDKIVVNASLDNINKIDIEISNSAWAYGSDLPQKVSNAELILTAGTGEIPLAYNSSSKTYRSNTVPKVGETYTLIVSRKNYQTVRTTCTIPAKLKNKASGWVEDGGKDQDGNTSDRVFIKFDDPAGRNYYMLHIYYYSQNIDLFIPFDFEKTDPSFTAPSTVSMNDGGYIITDELFSGTTKEFSVVPSRGLVAGNTDVKYLIELRSLSEDFYKYQTSLQRYRDQQDSQNNGPFSSAIIVHSNVSAGLGAFVSSTLESDTLR